MNRKTDVLGTALRSEKEWLLSATRKKNEEGALFELMPTEAGQLNGLDLKY